LQTGLTRGEMRLTSLSRAVWNCLSSSPASFGSPGTLLVEMCFDHRESLLSKRVSLLLVLLLLPSTTMAKVWRVRVGGNSDAPSIQAAIDSASVADTVLVGTGTFWESINFKGKDIVVRSEDGYGTTTLDGSLSLGPVVSFKSGETRQAVLDGFTITGGLGSAELGGAPKGGGVLCIGSSPSILNNRIHTNTLSVAHSVGAGMAVVEPNITQPTANPLIKGNIFENNSCAGNGGALAIQQACAVVSNNFFRNNSSAEDGGAIWSYLSPIPPPIIDHNWVSDNHADDHGGGIYVGSNSEALEINLTYNVVVRNSANGMSSIDTTSGGGIWLGNVSGGVAHNTIADNQGNDDSNCLGGVGLALYRVSTQLQITANIIVYSRGCGLVCTGSSPAFGPNLIWSDASPSDGGCDGLLESAVFANPLFCDPETDDYSVAADSPAHAGGTTMGAIEAPGCGPSRVHAATWGQIKSMFTQRKKEAVK